MVTATLRQSEDVSVITLEFNLVVFSVFGNREPYVFQTTSGLLIQIRESAQ
jgi:hypothetical protein